MNELNDALLWLAERQGRISFSVAFDDHLKGVEPPPPTVYVEAMSLTASECEAGGDPDLVHGEGKISAGNVTSALLAAISAARDMADSGSDEMVDEGDPNTD